METTSQLKPMDMKAYKPFTLDQLHAPDLKTFSYEFENVGYCPYGNDMNIMRVKVTITPEEFIPDASFISAQIREWRQTCVSESTEARAQQFLNYFWDLCKPKHIKVEFGSAGSRGTMIHSCTLEKSVSETLTHAIENGLMEECT